MSDKDSNTDSTSLPGLSEEELARIKEQVVASAVSAQEMVTKFFDSQPERVKMLFDPLNLAPAFLAMTRNLMQQPEKLMEAQAAYWQGFAQILDAQSRRLSGEDVAPVVEPAAGDKRFNSEAWSKDGPFDFLKQAYLLTASAIMDTVNTASGLEAQDRAKVAFFTRQYLDALSPSNFVFTNPDVLAATLEHKGQNLVRGMQNLMQDLERGKGLPMVKMVDLEAFEVGGNLAITPGKVVFRNRLFELLQYSPTTDEVYETPLVIFPPWINKYYILDLSEKKSFVRWAVAQGYTVFIVSWVNPDSSYADMDIDDYARDGILAAIDAVKKACKVEAVHTIGYCVAGTALAAVLAYLAAKGEAGQVATATFFTAQVDFSEAGDLTLFTDDKQIETIDTLMADKGYLDKRTMALTFNLLRSNDLIWSYVVNNYLLGKDPMAFDLLYWNCDSTHLPRTLHKRYLTTMYHENKLIEPGGLTLMGVPVDLTKIKTPSYVQAGREDHIAPARSVFKMREHFRGPLKFVLAGSGHIAGVVNPPAAEKYQYWTVDGAYRDFDDFVAKATEHKGSWWPDWDAWLGPQSGGKVKARTPGKGALKALADAPGSYVKMQGD